MMKKYFAMAAVATMFAACTNEDVTPQVDALTGTPIVVKTNIATPVDSRLAGRDGESDLDNYILNIQPQSEGDTDYFVLMQQNEGSWTSSEIIGDEQNHLNILQVILLEHDGGIKIAGDHMLETLEYLKKNLG